MNYKENKDFYWDLKGFLTESVSEEPTKAPKKPSVQDAARFIMESNNPVKKNDVSVNITSQKSISQAISAMTRNEKGNTPECRAFTKNNDRGVFGVIHEDTTLFDMMIAKSKKAAMTSGEGEFSKMPAWAQGNGGNNPSSANSETGDFSNAPTKTVSWAGNSVNVSAPAPTASQTGNSVNPTAPTPPASPVSFAMPTASPTPPAITNAINPDQTVNTDNPQANYRQARIDFYKKRELQNQQTAKERLAGIELMQNDKNWQKNTSLHGKIVTQTNQMRLQNASNTMDDAEIERRADSETKEKFLSPEDRAARKERDFFAVEKLKKAAREKMAVGKNDGRMGQYGIDDIEGPPDYLNVATPTTQDNPTPTKQATKAPTAPVSTFDATMTTGTPTDSPADLKNGIANDIKNNHLQKRTMMQRTQDNILNGETKFNPPDQNNTYNGVDNVRSRKFGRKNDVFNGETTLNPPDQNNTYNGVDDVHSRKSGRLNSDVRQKAQQAVQAGIVQPTGGSVNPTF